MSSESQERKKGVVLMKESKKTKINGETYHIYGLEESNSKDIKIFPKLIYGFNTIPIKIPVVVFADMDKLIVKCTYKGKGISRAKTIF